MTAGPPRPSRLLGMPAPTFARAALRRTGFIARRDERIQQLEAEVAALRDEASERFGRQQRAKHRKALASVASFQREIFRARRLAAVAGKNRRQGSSVIGGGKQHVLALMASHGVDIPRTLATWKTADDIEWDTLPDLIVLKGTRGAGSRGVYPLRRVGAQWQILTHETPVSSADLVAEIHELEKTGGVRGPYYAEEFLGSPDGDIPVDIKVYAFYGRAPMIVLVRPKVHGDRRTLDYRIIDPSGNDLASKYHNRPTDRTIPVPQHLAEAVAIAERISTIIRSPYARIDLYEQGDRIVFGEITPRPGGSQWMGAELDQWLGDFWEDAETRLWHDRAAGDPVLPELGPHAP